jgi:outer membrane lipoprotein-sorting protein
MDHRNDHPDDLLDRALSAMRHEPDAGDFPSARILQHIAASRDAGRQQIPLKLKRAKTMSAIFKIAAAVFLASALAGVLFISRDRRSVAFADIARQLDGAHTMTVDLMTSMPGQPELRMKAMFRGPGQFRFEHDDMIGIADAASGILLTLNNKEKTALVMHLHPTGPATTPAGPDKDWFATLKRISKADGKPVGEKQIEGRAARGFEVTESGQSFIVWADAQSGALVRVETLTPGATPPSPLVTLDHIRLDVPLDESLFSTAVPAGYSTRTAALNFDNSPPTEKDLIDLLRAYAKQTGGTFPPELGMRHLPQIVEKLIPPSQEKHGKVAPKELLETSAVLGRATAFLRQIPGKWGYAGDATPLGDGSKPLFWYEPTGSAKDRVIYADLHVGEAEPKDLPNATHTAFETTQPAALPPPSPVESTQPKTP